MKPKFEVGQRVRRRGEASTGEVTRRADPQRVFVKWDGYQSDFIIHEELLIRLRPKKRREIWVRERDIPKALHSGTAVISTGELVGDTYIRFREVRKARP